MRKHDKSLGYDSRSRLYRIGNLIYGHPNAITGPLILGHILKNVGHDVSVYEELYADVDYSKLLDADVSNAPRAYELADMLHQKSNARVLIGGMHASVLPEEALRHADQVIVGEGETVILDVVEGCNTEKIVHAPCLKSGRSVVPGLFPPEDSLRLRERHVDARLPVLLLLLHDFAHVQPLQGEKRRQRDR